MPISPSARVHPTALVDPRADLGEDVEIGPFAVIEGPVRLGAGCVVKMGAHLLGPLSLGTGNTVFSHAVLGEQPQHLRYAGEPTRLEIGDGNVFREHVTIHRAVTAGGVTRIGNANYFMVNSHVAHDCVVGDRCMLANGALVAGHCVLQDGVLMSGNSAVHQFVRVGRLGLVSGLAGSTMDLPPFMIVQRLNVVCGVNVIGMRRAGISHAGIDAVRKAFHLLYRSDMILSCSLPRIEQELGHVAEVAELLAFIRASKRGISLDYQRDAA
jgi:UDP-N-acetylglucosamine acyltransferase